MKKGIISILSLLLLSSSALAQSDPFKWQVAENTTVKLGGYVSFTASSYVDGAISGNDFITSSIPSSNDWSSENPTIFDPSSTRLSLEVTQSTDELGDIKMYIEGDFRGQTSSNIRLRQAYVSFKGFTVGQAWSFMSDLGSNAPTVDIQGVNSRTFFRTPLIGYRTKLSDKISAGISIEQASYSLSGISGYESVNQQVPDVPFYLQYNLSSGYIKAAGIVRTLQYGESLEESREAITAFGGQISGNGKIAPRITLYGQAIYGQGIGRYINDLASQSLDILYFDSELAATTMYGASLGGKVNISKGVDFVASYSQAGIDDMDEDFSGIYSHANYLSTTLFWSPVKKLTLGAEYLYGERTLFGGDSNTAQRVSLMVKYSL